jgi:hypothetical protein
MSRAPARLGSARVRPAGERVLALANSSRNSALHNVAMLGRRLFRRDAETDTRDACATPI